MTTFKINDDYDVTTSGPSRLPKGFEVTGTIWNSKTSKSTGIKVKGQGKTISAAQDVARARASEACPRDEDS
jgi:hypothetical protein